MVDFTPFVFEKTVLFFNHDGVIISLVLNFVMAIVPLILVLKLQNSKQGSPAINKITNSVIGMNLAFALRFIITGIDTMILSLSNGNLNLLAAWEYVPWLVVFYYTIFQIQGLISVPKQREWRINRVVGLIVSTMITLLVVSIINILQLSNLILLTGALSIILVMAPVIYYLYKEREENKSLLMKARIDLTIKGWWMIVLFLVLTIGFLGYYLTIPTEILLNPIYIILYNLIPGIIILSACFFFYWSLILPEFMRRKYDILPPESL